MGITELLDIPFYTGTGTTSSVPGLYPIALNARPYLVDLKSNLYRNQSLTLLRSQADTQNLPGGQSINPDDLWRRPVESWHQGAGQVYLDRTDSSADRYHASKGVDPWTKFQFSLLPDTGTKRTSANTNLALVVSGARLYLIDGGTINASLLFTTTSSTSSDFTAVTGTPAATAKSVTSDGLNIYAAYGASGIYQTTNSTSTAASYITGTINLVRYVMGRLIVAGTGPSLYNVTQAVGGAAVAIGTQTLLNTTSFLPTDWTWVDITEGLGFIYAGGFSGDKSVVYKITIQSDGTSLAAPTVAGVLPSGEIIRSLRGYLGFVAIGTDKGVRFCNVDGAGNLIVGPLLNLVGAATSGTNLSVQCFETQDRFIWFGWTNYDGTSTGLGRMDLSVFTAPLAPAFASDLMFTGQGTVSSVVTYLGIRVFAVSGAGVVVQSANKVSVAQIDSGQFTYGIPDSKVGMYFDVRSEPLAGSYEVQVSPDAGAYVTLGTFTSASSVANTFPIGQVLAKRFEIRNILTRSGTDSTTGPTIHQHNLRAYAAPNRGQTWTLPLIFSERLYARNQEFSFAVATELDAIRNMIANHTLVTFQEGSNTHSVFVEDFEYRPLFQTLDGTFFDGLCIVRIKEVAL